MKDKIFGCVWLEIEQKLSVTKYAPDFLNTPAATSLDEPNAMVVN